MFNLAQVKSGPTAHRDWRPLVVNSITIPSLPSQHSCNPEDSRAKQCDAGRLRGRTATRCPADFNNHSSRGGKRLVLHYEVECVCTCMEPTRDRKGMEVPVACINSANVGIHSIEVNARLVIRAVE